MSKKLNWQNLRSGLCPNCGWKLPNPYKNEGVACVGSIHTGSGCDFFITSKRFFELTDKMSLDRITNRDNQQGLSDLT